MLIQLIIARFVPVVGDMTSILATPVMIFKCVVCQYCLGADQNASENIRFLALPHIRSKVGGWDSRRNSDSIRAVGVIDTSGINDKTRGCNTLVYTSANAKHPYKGLERTFVVNPG